MKRSLQQSMYQKAMYAKANLIVATTLWRKTIWKEGWNKRIALIRYSGYSHLTNTEAMMQNWQETDEETLAVFEQQKAEAIAAQTKQAIIAQIMQIKAACRIRIFRKIS